MIQGTRILVWISFVIFYIDCGGLPISSFPITFEENTVYKYDYSTETLFNSGIGKPVGFLFTSTIQISPVWLSDSEQILMRLTIVANPRLQGVYQQEISREFFNLPNHPIYFLWSAGKVHNLYTHEKDTVLAITIKKGIISLFQFQLEDIKINELDVAGTCEVQYSVKNENFVTKNKGKCRTSHSMPAYSSANKLFDVDVDRTSTIDFITDDGGDKLVEVYSNEKWGATVGMDPSLDVYVQTRQNLTFKTLSKSEKTSNNIPFENFIKKLNKGKGGSLKEMSLESWYQPSGCLEDMPCASLPELVKSAQLDLSSNMIGRNVATKAALPIIYAIRQAEESGISKLLEQFMHEEQFPAVVDLIVAAQTESSVHALQKFLDFNNEDQIELLERFLLASALTTHPTQSTVQYLLDEFKKKNKNDILRESIGESLGSVVFTFAKNSKQHHAILEEVEKAFMLQLNESLSLADIKFRLMIIRGLSNAAFPNSLPVLLNIGETSNFGLVSEAALKALRRFDKSHIAVFKENLLRIFHQKSRGFETQVRSIALTYLLDLAPSFSETKSIFLESLDPWNTDYSLYIQSRLKDAAKRDDIIKNYLKEILRDTTVNNYHVLSPKGNSIAFSSHLFDSPETLYLMYVENGRSGIMKRSGMSVQLTHLDTKIPIYNFELYASGLEGMMGEEVEQSEIDAPVTAGLNLDMVGVSLRPVTFFTGQSGLMSAIWSAPAELVSALQTNFLLEDHLSYLHLQNGLVAEVFLQGIASLDVSGSMSVSLWNKNAQSLIQSRGSLLRNGGVRLDTSAFRAGIEFSKSTESSLDFATDVDFYDGNKLCLQMSRPATTLKQKFMKYENARGFKTSMKTRRKLKKKFEGVSYPMHPTNYDKCRQLMKID